MQKSKKWLDISPHDWFFRSIAEADTIYLDQDKEETLLSPKTYNKFKTGKTRNVFNFTTSEGQTSFSIKGYKPDSREKVTVYIDGVPTKPSKLASGKVHIGYPIAGGKDVSVVLSGVVDMHEGTHESNSCQSYPLSSSCSEKYPTKKLEMQKKYVFDVRYSLNELAVCLNRKLRRISVRPRANESVQKALQRTIGLKDDCFTIIDGYLYTSHNLNGFPVFVNYNYKAGAVIKNRQREKVVPKTDCPKYSDMFFPEITISKGEFFYTLQRMRINIYNRYSDRGYQPKITEKTERYIKDRPKIVGKWYEEEVLNIMDEKFNDGCYVFPLYDDKTFQPETCMTKAETAVYLNRFIEWALERFR
ncbi:hypothetical protein [Bacillus pumilus]|uniref:hypothetical protein n=1 Tax=Bacillus pumilus TaxID=1408 RepID=UPI0011E952A3|nr:hypothetical protein [Bacillus pumilus]TYS40456.1 hypothetical protein FZC68_16745 [Bacillus pumilus]